jgi:hypothetical protein
MKLGQLCHSNKRDIHMLGVKWPSGYAQMHNAQRSYALFCTFFLHLPPLAGPRFESRMHTQKLASQAPTLMRPNFVCGVSSPFLTLPPILTLGAPEVAVYLGDIFISKHIFSLQTEIKAALGASLTHPSPGAQIPAAATTPHAPILDRVSWL